MRRKSERTASKKSKPSPEKKEKHEKGKHSRTRRRKQSSSSASESTEEATQANAAEIGETTKTNEPPKLAKDENPKESQDQVWQVKSTEASGDVGEIQKLKLCLARPPSTPERVDRSPRSKRKHSRATSSSDTQSVEGEDKKKSRRRAKRCTESKDVDKNDESQGDEAEVEIKDVSPSKPLDSEVGQTASQNISTDETPMSTTTEDTKCDKTTSETSENETVEEKQDDEKATETEAPKDTEVQEKTSETETVIESSNSDIDKQPTENISLPSRESPDRKRSLSAEKSEILELHAEESRCDSSEVSFNESQDARSKVTLDQDKEVSNFVPSEVSINKSTTEISGQPGSNFEDKVISNESDLDNDKEVQKEVIEKTESDENQDVVENMNTENVSQNNKEQNSQCAEIIPNGEVTPLVLNRKRRWGSRQNKLSSQKSITISTDVLKEIIPDVKPVEFEEVIEEKKHKRIGVPEKIDRPILPKIIIDNTESLEVNKKDKKVEDKNKENVKIKDISLSSMRKISIVNDHDSIIARPPSPPKHKQSSILYITNLVRPFTLPQLKNLLQRTGRIVDNGFWIDRIKSKCFVKYSTEDQAVETRHALHGVTWPVSNPKTLHVDFSTQEDFDKAKANEDTDNAQISTIPGTVEDWLREQDMKREKGELEKPWERKAAMREWDVGKNEKSKEVSRQDKIHRDERPTEKRRHRTIERSPEPARKFKKKEEEAPAKLLDDLFRKTKATPCIYWLPLSAETIAVKEEQRRQHMAEHERRLQELRRTQSHRRH